MCLAPVAAGIGLTAAMTTTPALAARPRRRTLRCTRTITGAAAGLLCLGVLSACGGADLDAAKQAGTTVGDAVKAESEKAGADITTAIAEEPWKGRSDAFVSGTYDFLVVNVDEKACAKLVFAEDEPGADYTIEDTYDC